MVKLKRPKYFVKHVICSNKCYAYGDSQTILQNNSDTRTKHSQLPHSKIVTVMFKLRMGIQDGELKFILLSVKLLLNSDPFPNTLLHSASKVQSLRIQKLLPE